MNKILQSLRSFRMTIILITILIGTIWFQQTVAPSREHFGNLPAAEDKPRTTTLLAVGDIMLSRHVGEKIDKANDPNLPFDKLRELTNGADIAFGNLECPLSPSTIPIREGLIFRCPTKYVPGLVNAGFDVLSTANNHSLDQGADNIAFTVDYLKQNSILPVGTGRDHTEAHAGRILTPSSSVENLLPSQYKLNSVRFGFLGYSYSAHNDGRQTPDPQIATMDIDQLKTDIANIKSRGADVVIVNMHAGTEYTSTPNQMQIDFAHAAIDAGADIVLGHHPHWIQTVEVYNSPYPPSPTRGEESQNSIPLPRWEGQGEGEPHSGLILYSLGNFVFDQMWSEETREGLAVELTFEEEQLQSAKLIPVIIENFCCPRMATEEEKTNILKKIGLESNILNFSQ